MTMLCLPFIQSCSEEAPAPAVIKKVKAIQIGSYDLLEKRAFPGKAQAAQEASLSFRVSGQVASLPVNVGDKVKAGDILATLDDTDFKNAVNIAEGLLGEAKAAYVDAAKDYQRALNIQKKDPGIISEAMIDKAKANSEITAAAQRSAEANLQLAKDRLSYTQIKAPFDGEVVATYVENFETTIAKQNILRILNPEGMEFVFEVPESLIGYANAVKSANIKFDIAPNTELKGTLKEIGREASTSTRTYPITLVIENTADVTILPGMAGKANIVAELPQDSALSGIVVPASSLFSEGAIENSFVWVINDNKVSKRAVKLGPPSNYGLRIKEGLQPGDWIVVAGVHSIMQDQQVRVMDVTAEKD